MIIHCQVQLNGNFGGVQQLLTTCYSSSRPQNFSPRRRHCEALPNQAVG